MSLKFCIASTENVVTKGVLFCKTEGKLYYQIAENLYCIIILTRRNRGKNEGIPRVLLSKNLRFKKIYNFAKILVKRRFS